MAQQGEIPQGYGFVAQALKLYLYRTPARFVAGGGIDPRALQADIDTLLHTAVVRIVLDANKEFRSWPAEHAFTGSYRLEAWDGPTDQAVVERDFRTVDPYHRTGRGLSFGFLPIPRENDESEDDYRRRVRCCKPLLAPLNLIAKQVFSVIIEFTEPPNFTTEDELRIKCVLEGNLTTDVEIATGVAGARGVALANPSALPTIMAERANAGGVEIPAMVDPAALLMNEVPISADLEEALRGSTG